MKAVLLATLLLTCLSRAAEPHIIINAKILGIPVDSPALLSTGLVMDPAGGMQNLGILPPGRAAAVLDKLATAKGVNLLSTPSVTTKDGQRATVEIAREFIYPTEFDLGAIKNAPDGKPITLKPGESISATPVTPTAFETRSIGIRMDFLPTLQGDGSIDLQLAPEVTTFDGFIDYGTPMKIVSTDAKGGLHEKVLVDNKIQQPLFQSLKTTTTVTLQPGQFLLLGGLGASASASNAPGQLEMKQKASLQPAKPTQLIFFMIEAKLMRE